MTLLKSATLIAALFGIAPLFSQNFDVTVARTQRSVALFDAGPFKSAAVPAAPLGHGFSTIKSLGDLSFGLGLGTTLDPFGGSLHTELDVYLLRYLAVGPLLQFSFDGEGIKLAASIQAKGVADWGGNQPFKPFITAGVGILQRINSDTKHNCKCKDYGLLVTGGLGADFYLRPWISLGFEIIANWLPKQVLEDGFSVDIQFVTIRIHI